MQWSRVKIGKPIWGTQRILILALNRRKYAVKTDKNFGSWLLTSGTTVRALSAVTSVPG